MKSAEQTIRFLYGSCTSIWLALIPPLLLSAYADPGTHNTQPDQEQVQSVTSSPGGEEEREESMADLERLTEEEGAYLLGVARTTIDAALSGSEESAKEDTDLPPVFREKRGTFVTLTMDGNLRGCIGHIIPQGSLIEGVRINAMSAAFRDPRFSPLRREEWPRVKLEVSILTDPRPLDYQAAADLLQKIRPHVDGLIIKKGYRQATFLPQVWEQLPTKEEFLSHLCLKAGLSADEWKKGGLEVLTYQTQAFEE
jgi:AmmeMemoRadiSam system protein A